MGCFTCAGRRLALNNFATLSRAAAKAASAKFRRLGGLPAHVDWAARAATCELCPLRVVRGGVSYCGEPLLRRLDRNPVADGCGCPTHDKARNPGEHCPLDASHRPARRDGEECNCKWCEQKGGKLEIRNSNDETMTKYRMSE